MSEWENEGMEIDWENPFDEIRSSEIDTIKLQFIDNGKKVTKLDEKEEEYTQYRFKALRLDISNPTEITYITSSKRLIEEIQAVAPIAGKEVEIVKSGSGFQTKYKVKEL